MRQHQITTSVHCQYLTTQILGQYRNKNTSIENSKHFLNLFHQHVQWVYNQSPYTFSKDNPYYLLIQASQDSKKNLIIGTFLDYCSRYNLIYSGITLLSNSHSLSLVKQKLQAGLQNHNLFLVTIISSIQTHLIVRSYLSDYYVNPVYLYVLFFMLFLYVTTI